MEINNTSVRELGTVRTALATARTLAEKSGDAAIMFNRLLDRFEKARDELQIAYTANPTDPPCTTAFIDLLLRLHGLLTPYSNQILAGRVVQHTRFYAQVQDIHEELTHVFRPLGVAVATVDQEHRWSAKVKEDYRSYKATLAKQVEDTELLQASVQDEREYLESFTVLKFASNSYDATQWNELAKKMLPLIVALNPRADSAPPEVPKWFIPSSDVRYYTNSFANGSFGSVHHGTWGPATDVVVKVLLEVSGRLDISTREAFMDEANLWFQFSHPNVVRMFGACHLSSPPFIVCENATNGNLSEYLCLQNNKADSLWRSLFWAALGLDYLHKKNVIHGDLKLNNILVGKDTYARVADFGLSRVKNSSKKTMTKLKHGQRVEGGLRWRAPECFSVTPQRESDVFAFAMCMFEAVEGEPPFAHIIDDESVKSNILRGQLPEQPKDMPDEMWALVEKMTTMDPKERVDMTYVVKELKVWADKEETIERDSYLVCGHCFHRLPTKTAIFCEYCGKVVTDEERLPAENEDLKILTEEEVPRVVKLLTLGTKKQKMNATEALKKYVFGEPTHQIQVKNAGAMSILSDLLVDEDEDIRFNALLALGSAVAVHDITQDSGEFEGAIPRMANMLENDTPKLKPKAAMALGLIADNNDKNIDIIKRTRGTIALIRAMEDSPDPKDRSAAEMALEFLEPEDDTGFVAGPTADYA